MKARGPGRFAVGSSLLAVASCSFLLPTIVWLRTDVLGWALLGWFLMASIGVAGGTWMTAVHGRPDAAFIVALGTCMLARLTASAAGAFAAADAGGRAVWAYLAGLGVGYVPLQVFEVSWLVRRSSAGTDRKVGRRPAAGAEGRRR